MKAVRPIQIALFIGATFGLAACNSYTPKTSNMAAAPSGFVLSNPSFFMIQSQILQPHCYECHTVAGGDHGDVNLETYANVIKNLDDIQQEVLNKGAMPPKSRGSLSDADKQLLANWIAQGGPELVTAPAATTSPMPNSNP